MNLTERREKLLGPNVPTFYDEPVHLVRGQGVWLWDDQGRKYLDCYNNVPHVGHCHPKVVEAIATQAATLNTHTRYHHTGILDYLERLLATFDIPMENAIFTCTGSEANDIALRMAQAVTGARGVIATDHTYHGNTVAVSQLSKTSPPIGGYGGHVRHVPAPDSYRGADGAEFAAHVAVAVAELQASEHGFSAIMLDPYFANEGFPDLPKGWLDPALEVVRKAGGLFIADEVQPGFGRTGEDFWGHQRIGAKPDIVTMGKPMGNGHPVACVATTVDIMHAFRTGFRYFNTFGGNPVSCAAASATLDVLESEGLQENARVMGEYLRAGLRKLADTHEVIGNVRGAGLFMGAELVADRETKQPVPEYVDRVVNGLRDQGILLSKGGRNYTTLKIRPPMPFSAGNADQLLATLDSVLSKMPFDPND